MSEYTEGQDTREAWDEPELATLDVTEAQGLPGIGGDGGGFADCTLS